MKLKVLFIVLFIISSGNINAQKDGILNAFKKSAVKYGNDKDGDGVEDENTKRSEKEKEWQKKWNETLKGLEPSDDQKNIFSGKFENCVYVMINYLDALENLARSTESEANCKMKYDLYGMQVSAIAMSNTIMYCPEHMDEENMSDEELETLFWNMYKKVLAAPGYTPDPMYSHDFTFANKWNIRIKNVFELNGWVYNNGSFDSSEIPVEMIRSVLTDKFRPKYVILKSLEIQQKMEALGCSD